MRKLLGVWLVWGPLLVQAQFAYVPDQDVPVSDISDNALALPWAGGLNAAQYNTLDLNGDDVPDLVLFDRMANKVITYINDGSQYRYAPDYEALFPELTNWLLLRDYNCDGKKDIFTGDVAGIKVYTNTTPADGPLAWEQFLFFSGSSHSPVLLTENPATENKVNLILQYDDLPSISDMDGDGDLDILCMNYFTGITVEYHQNLSQEDYSSCDSLIFKRITQTWGDFKECECGTFAYNGADCPSSGGGRIKHAGGKALLALDIDNDLDQDIIFSEADCNNLFLLENEGDAATPSFSGAVAFPASTPADLVTFPAAFYEDVDFDGVHDLIVTPNLYNKESLEIDFRTSNWLYKNNGTSQQPDLAFVTKGFLQDQMIDVGDNAVPAFADMDGDGDLDMFIGQNTGHNIYASLHVFENTGTIAAPAFRLATDNYLDLSGLLLYNMKPYFYDVNADGRTDLILSATNTTNQTKLYTLLNKSANGLDFSGQLFNEVTLSILFSQNVHFTDVDQDGLPDLLVGKDNGTIAWWKNNGPQGSLNLSLQDDRFLGIGPSLDYQNLSISTGDLDADGNADLVFGTLYGTLHIVSNYRNVSGTSEPVIFTDIVYDEIQDTYTSRNFGGRVWPVVANLFNTSRPAIVAGNLLGGIQILRHDETASIPEVPDISIYPNPVEQSEILNITVDRAATVQLISVLGQEMIPPASLDAYQVYPVNVAGLAAGLYLVRIMVNNISYTKRIIIY